MTWTFPVPLSPLALADLGNYFIWWIHLPTLVQIDLSGLSLSIQIALQNGDEFTYFLSLFDHGENQTFILLYLSFLYGLRMVWLWKPNIVRMAVQWNIRSNLHEQGQVSSKRVQDLSQIVAWYRIHTRSIRWREKCKWLELYQNKSN